MKQKQMKNRISQSLCWSKWLIVIAIFLFSGLPQSLFAVTDLTNCNRMKYLRHGYTEDLGYYLDFRFIVRSERGHDNIIYDQDLVINGNKICRVRWCSGDGNAKYLRVINWSKDVDIEVRYSSGKSKLKAGYGDSYGDVTLGKKYRGLYSSSIDGVRESVYTEIRVFLPAKYWEKGSVTWNSIIVNSDNVDKDGCSSIRQGSISSIYNIVPPHIINLQYSISDYKRKLTLSWVYSHTNNKAYKVYIFRKKNNAPKWELYKTIDKISNIITDQDVINCTSTYADGDWQYAVSLDVDKKGLDAPVLSGVLSKYSKTVSVNFNKPLPQKVSIDFNPSNYNLTLNWKYLYSDNDLWSYSIFRKNKVVGAWEILKDSIPLKKGDSQEKYSFKINSGDFEKEWVYAVSLNSAKGGKKISGTKGYVDSTMISITPPYPQNLKAEADTLTHELPIVWSYENPQKLNWKYALYKEGETPDSWELVTDSIPLGTSVADTVRITLNPQKKELRLTKKYAISLIEDRDKTPDSPLDSYYYETIEVQPILPPIPYAKYLKWAGIGLAILLVVLVFILKRIGFRF